MKAPVLSIVVAGICLIASNNASAAATVDDALASKQDLWGLQAMQQTNGPTYQFFERLLPPLRYVNAEFKHYPIVLSAPGAAYKARLTSNGSGINARAGLSTWKEIGTPVYFFVGKTNEPFGHNLNRLTGPKYERGYLPIVHLDYLENGNAWSQESFVTTVTPFSEHGVVFSQLVLRIGRNATATARVDSPQSLIQKGSTLQNTNGEIIVWLDSKHWQWDSANKTLSASLNHGEAARLAIATKPMKTAIVGELDGNTFARHRSSCISTWQRLLDAGTQIDVPESYVNDAWRATICGCQMVRKGDAMNYSSGNAYDRLYQAECGDVMRGLALFGASDLLPMQSRLLDYTRDTLVFHNAGFKLQSVAHLFWLTHDTNFISALRPKWEKEIQRVIDGREKASGLFPKERYCGDIETPVYALNPNANCWRGLRDMAAVLQVIGETNRASELFKVAAEFRSAIFQAVDKSEFRNTQPPFIPMMLFGQEKPYDRLTSSMLASYYDLIAPYVIGSGVLGPGSERDRWMIDYLQEHGGIAIGMIRFDQHSGLFANTEGVDDLYGIRYTTKLLELDEVDRALVSFYGKLAQGLTRDTFIGAEGTSFRSLDQIGRPMYLPPNTSASALLLWTLRNLLVQDWDLDDDGRPETLRLLFATPRDWMADGKSIHVENAPTAFGNVSVTSRSRLARGEIVVEVTTPNVMSPTHTFIRARVPAGFKVASARVGKQTLHVDDKGTADITGYTGRLTVRFKVAKS